MRLAFCQRDMHAARRDLVRICSEIRDELSPTDLPSCRPGACMARAPAERRRHAGRRILGAIYVSCSRPRRAALRRALGRGADRAHALGDVPLAGFFAGGEIARHHLYGYTGVLTVFAAG